MSQFSDLREFLVALPDVVRENGEEACYRTLDTKLQALETWRQCLSPEEDQREMARFRELLGPIVSESTFCRYAFDRPRGFAGDYVTQVMIWRGRTLGGTHRYDGTTEAGRLINALTFDMDNCRANVERIQRLRDMLAQAGPRIASIGSGCGIEFWRAGDGEVLPRDILLVDKDSEALDYARAHIAGGERLALTCRVDNVLKFALGDPGPESRGRDFVYAFGLLDYFPLRQAQRIAQGLWQFVAPGGTLVLTNAHPRNPTRLWMEYVGRWFLEYKDEQAMRSLADGLPGVAAVSLTPDSFGVYQYLRVEAEPGAAAGRDRG